MEPYPPNPSQPGPDARFHYPQYKSQQPESAYPQPSQYQQFPPHPSVRVPPNVKLSARQVPMGVGVAPPPVKYSPRLQQRPPGSGQLIQDFKFPAVPPIPPSNSGRVKQDKYNMHQSYVSSLAEDFPTPRTTPGSRSRGFPNSKRYSGSVYAESDALGAQGGFDQEFLSPEMSRPSSPETTPQIVRQASLGKRAKPAMTTIKNRNSQMEQDIPEHRPPPIQSGRNATMTALSVAVAAGVSSQVGEARSGTPGSRSYTPVRMPFDTSPPASPSADKEFLQTPKSLNTTASSKFPGQPPSTGHSHQSTNPLLGLGIDQPSMSDKIPPSRRPPKLDMDAVRDAENRGSTTSLADLIKRATKLAANLDRGRTASRLGMLDMFGSNEKLGGNNRHSTMSDMISAFPAPAFGGTPTNKRDADWPLGEKGGAYASTSDLSKGATQKRRRRCCGLSLPVFIAVLVVIIILIAAAVLIPIFLILVPRQHHSSVDLSDCASSHPCGNGGTSIVDRDTCVCVCSNGFTGSQCETSGNAEDCMTITLNDGAIEYKNATIGLSIMPPLSDAQTRFDIPLNVSTILSLFSSNNLTCTSENSLMDFNSSSLNQGTQTKRFVMLPGFEPPAQPSVIYGEPHRPGITNRAEPDCSELSLERRQDEAAFSTGTSNGIVFQASSATISSVSPAATAASDVSTVTSVSGTTTLGASPTASNMNAESPSPSSSATPSSAVTEEDQNFAKVVVLFALQESHTMAFAVNAQQRMELFFTDLESGNGTTHIVDVGSDTLPLRADFEKFTIIKGDGEAVGG